MFRCLFKPWSHYLCVGDVLCKNDPRTPFLGAASLKKKWEWFLICIKIKENLLKILPIQQRYNGGMAWEQRRHSGGTYICLQCNRNSRWGEKLSITSTSPVKSQVMWQGLKDRPHLSVCLVLHSDLSLMTAQHTYNIIFLVHAFLPRISYKQPICIQCWAKCRGRLCMCSTPSQGFMPLLYHFWTHDE